MSALLGRFQQGTNRAKGVCPTIKNALVKTNRALGALLGFYGPGINGATGQNLRRQHTEECAMGAVKQYLLEQMEKEAERNRNRCIYCGNKLDREERAVGRGECLDCYCRNNDKD